MKDNPDITFINDDMWWSNDDLNAYEYLKQTDSNFFSKIHAFLNNTNVAISAGGHCGWLVRELKPYFDFIYTFEPNSIEFLCLTMNHPEEKVIKFNTCLGNEHNLINMTKHEGASGANFVGNKENGIIPTILIDDLNLNQCDFIQLDLEGYEYYALLGAKNTIEKFRPLLSIERVWNLRYNITPEQINELLDNWDYKLVNVIEADHIYGCF